MEYYEFVDHNNTVHGVPETVNHNLPARKDEHVCVVPSEDQIAAAQTIIREYSKNNTEVATVRAYMVGAMSALEKEHTSRSVRLAIQREHADAIHTSIVEDLYEMAESESEVATVHSRADEEVDLLAQRAAREALGDAHDHMLTRRTYAAVHPHVKAGDDQAARDYGAARACEVAGHKHTMFAMMVDYGCSKSAVRYISAITNAARRANQPQPQTKAEPESGHTPRAPW